MIRPQGTRIKGRKLAHPPPASTRGTLGGLFGKVGLMLSVPPTLLRPHGERPGNRRAAEQRDEVAASCMTRKEHSEGWRGSVHDTAPVATGSPQAPRIPIRE
jgi:hypothetical protein